ncbi:hypothetical protein ACE1ET_04890 [Saccharicrinis sp. FJH62]|uniref:hypothetical protein n=1 Tax=Saccharicrinis sp. FJH62 TaxID=3344657 RepID=UPI0035D3F8A6
MKGKLFCIVSILLLSSCALYTPQVAPPILIEEKGETELDFGASISSFLITPGADVSVAYGFTDKIHAQAYASYISSGTIHLQLLTGYRFNINERANIRLLGGYFYGNGNVKYQEGFNEPMNYKGFYQSILGKFQYTNTFKNHNKIWGLSFTIGNFTPYYKVYYVESSNDMDKVIDQKGILFEPYLFYHYKISDKLGITFSYSNTWIKPINQLNNDYPNHYELDYNKYGNFGITLKYTLKTGNKKRLNKTQ